MEQRILHKITGAKTKSSFEKILECLPESVSLALKKCPCGQQKQISEIRIRDGSTVTVTLSGKNLFLTSNGITPDDLYGIKTNEKELEQFLYKLCKGSVYAYEGSVKNGFITVDGIRAGICGDVTLKGTEVNGFSRIHGFNIRLPCHIDGCADMLTEYVSAHGFKNNSGILVASAPGVGKTTVLRDFALKLSSGISIRGSDAKRVFRVCIIDERNEIFIPDVFENTPVDVYGGIPKKQGIEFASRLMSPEVIICDEIGSETDAALIKNAHAGGTSLVASVHADSVKDILSKPELFGLCADGIFSHIYLLRRTADGVSGILIPVSDCLKDGVRT